MTVGREISPECSTDERREWQKGAAALAISSRRPTGWLGSRMIRSMYASGSSPVAAASCRTCSFARAGRSLGAASARPFSTVSVHRAIARLIENRGPCVSASGSLILQYGTDFVLQYGTDASSVARWEVRIKPCFFAPRTTSCFFCTRLRLT